MNYLAALTGLLVGGNYGYNAQRGAFCMNSGFPGSAITSVWTQRGMSRALESGPRAA